MTLNKEVFDFDQLRQVIRNCQSNKHIQQVAYSTHHDGITQICFTCNKVRTSINDTK